MLGALIWLLSFQWLGEVAVHALGLPFPGPVVGMALLFGALALGGGVPDDLRATGDGMLRHLTLLLVPATAGVIRHAERVGAEWLPIVLATVGGAAVTLTVTALTLRLLLAVGRARGR